MLLPQSSAFSTLRNRLSSVSSLGFLHVMPKRWVCLMRYESDCLICNTIVFNSYPEPAKRPGSKSVPGKQDEPSIKFQDLLIHFKNVQARHEKFRRQGMNEFRLLILDQAHIELLLLLVLQNLARGTNSRSRRGKERMSTGPSSAPLSGGYSNLSQATPNINTLLNRSDGRDRVLESSSGPRSTQERQNSATRSSSPPGGRIAGRSRLRKT